jgi:hypothetical protein
MIVLFMLPVIAFAHYTAFPQETRCIFIRFSSLDHQGEFYTSKGVSQGLKDSIQALIGEAEKRIDQFWGAQKAEPTFIYCANPEDYRKYGNMIGSPATTYNKLGSYIVLNRDGLDPDIIAHELSHAEFYSRIGFIAQKFRVPAWFDEGLAMQVDYRADFSLDSLRRQSNDFRDLPDIKSLKSGQAFMDGSDDEVLLRFMTAKYIVGQWYNPERLQQFTASMKSGRSFDAAYQQ